MEDGEAAFCSYCVLNMNMKPSDFINLPPNEKAFIIACIRLKMDNNRQQ